MYLETPLDQITLRYLINKNKKLLLILRHIIALSHALRTCGPEEIMSYFCVTCHFIDQDWALQKRIIAFKMMEYPHSGQNIYSHVMSVFRGYEISEKIFSITFDNVSANDSSIKIFQRNLTPPHGGNFIMLDVVVT